MRTSTPSIVLYLSALIRLAAEAGTEGVRLA